jgi:hypothetical protein
MDGNPWIIVKGEDFDCEVPSIRAHLYRKVREEGMALISTEVEHNGQPALAFRVVSEDEVPNRSHNDEADETEDLS